MIRWLLQPSADFLDHPSLGRIAGMAGISCVCLAVYGFSAGIWRSPEMALYVAIKMPLMIGCTLGCNALLSGLLGSLLGGLGFRQSWLALLSCFATASLILGSLAPVTFLLATQIPGPGSASQYYAYTIHQLFHVGLVAIAGITGAVSLHKILLARCPSPSVAHATLGAWLLGNGFLGAQFSWIFRPFFGLPNLEVAFIRPHPLQGSFYETTSTAIRTLASSESFLSKVPFVIMAMALLAIWYLKRSPSRTTASSPISP